jgi:lysozyme
MSWFLNIFFKKNNNTVVKKTQAQIIVPPVQNIPEIPTPTEVENFLAKPFLNFPDISHYETCDFSEFEVNDMLTKATEGVSFIDSTLKFNMEGCKKKGIRFGAYHFYLVAIDPIIQARHYIDTVGLENLKSFYYEPIIDFETKEDPKTKHKIQDEADLKNAIPDLKKFLNYIEIETGRVPMFYSYESLIQYLELDSSFEKYRLWIARYGKEPTSFLPWKKYWSWQYADGEISNPKYSDSFKGIGRCDANVFYKEKL